MQNTVLWKKIQIGKTNFYNFLTGRAQSGARGGPHNSAPRQKFKNRLGAPESIPMRSFSPKNEPIRPRGLSCGGGGAIDFDGRAVSISGTSVVGGRRCSLFSRANRLSARGKSKRRMPSVRH